MTWSEIGAGKYALLTTYKKDGSPVASPVWLAVQDGRIVVAANADSWKIKRIRRNPSVTLQLCDARGAVGIAIARTDIGTSDGGVRTTS